MNKRVQDAGPRDLRVSEVEEIIEEVTGGGFDADPFLRALSDSYLSLREPPYTVGSYLTEEERGVWEAKYAPRAGLVAVAVRRWADRKKTA